MGLETRGEVLRAAGQGRSFAQASCEPRGRAGVEFCQCAGYHRFPEDWKKAEPESEFHMKPRKCGETRTDGCFWNFWDGGESMNDNLPFTPIGVLTFWILQQ